MLREDPSLKVRQDADSGQTILSGMGELQLEVSIEKLRARHGVDVTVGRPQVAYRETISTESEVHHVHKKQSGGPGQFAELTLRLAPLARGEGFRFANESVGGAIPREFVPAIEAGIRRAAQVGVAAGFPTVDFEATVLDGGFHERDSSSLAFELAAAAAFREAAARAAPLVLEPVMAVEVITPIEHLGDVIGDLHRRRGNVQGQAQRGNASRRDRDGAAEGDVRLHRPPARHDLGPGAVLDADEPLRRGAGARAAGAGRVAPVAARRVAWCSVTGAHAPSSGVGTCRDIVAYVTISS